jgi:tRNA pseudouridine65 synthase
MPILHQDADLIVVNKRSGLLEFALSKGVARTLGEAFQRGEVGKRYLAVVRGIAPEKELVDYPLKEELDRRADAKTAEIKPAQAAVTHLRRLASCELNVQVDRLSHVHTKA